MLLCSLAQPFLKVVYMDWLYFEPNTEHIYKMYMMMEIKGTHNTETNGS